VSYFVYKLIPPRPTFDQDMSEAEGEVMEKHFGYWQDVIDRGQVIVYGPVSDPSGTWGLAVLEVESDDAARKLAEADPAVSSGVSTFAIFPMAEAVVRS
jgi:uncharacterized protein YciI